MQGFSLSNSLIKKLYSTDEYHDQDGPKIDEREDPDSFMEQVKKHDSNFIDNDKEGSELLLDQAADSPSLNQGISEEQ